MEKETAGVTHTTPQDIYLYVCVCVFLLSEYRQTHRLRGSDRDDKRSRGWKKQDGKQQ